SEGSPASAFSGVAGGYQPRAARSSPANAPGAEETSGMPAVSSSIRAGEPVAVFSTMLRSCAWISSRTAALRDFLSSFGAQRLG
ncbi:hypothetical protein, partial [Promicromonospora sp. NPDC057488]|uniref:hypothetical protein n=1 Tax=Promicromonospora sp. NPDC057488 TaxID=3346147 RepID=UPI00366CF992